MALLLLGGFVAVAGIAATGLAEAPAPATAAVDTASVDTAEPLSCPAMLDESTRDSLDSAGWELIDRSPQPGEDQFPFVQLGGSACMWGLPQSDAFTWIAYSPVSDSEAAAQQSRLSSLGFTSSAILEGELFQRAQPSEQRYLFSDGFWYLAAADETLLEVRANVMEASVIAIPNVAVEPEPSAAEEPGPRLFEGLGSGNLNAPSSISSLATLQGLELSPAQVGVTAGVAAVLVAIIGFPGKLVESALSANYDALSRRLRPVLAPVRRVLTPARARLRLLPRWPLIVGGLVVAAIVSGFIDPQFGPNAGSVRMFASLLLTLIVESVLVVWLVSRLVRRRQPGLGTRFEFKFGSLLVLLVVVLASRATGFEPGMLIGVVLALGYAVTPDPATELRASIAEAGVLFGVGIASWIAYSVATGLGGADVASVFLRETLGGFAIAALAALPIVLLPWRGLVGGVIYSWRRGAWFAAYAVSMLSFLVILMPMPESWAEINAPLATWVLAYLAFAAGAVAIWAFLTFGVGRVSEPPAQETPEPRRETRVR